MTTELEIIVEYQRRRIDDLQGERARLGEQLDRLGEQVDRLQGLLEREQVLRQQAQGQLDRSGAGRCGRSPAGPGRDRA